MSQTQTHKGLTTLDVPAGIATADTFTSDQSNQATQPAEKKNIHVGCPSFLQFGTKDSPWSAIGTEHILNAFDAFVTRVKAMPDCEDKTAYMSQICRGQFDAGQYWNFVSKETGKDSEGNTTYVNVDTPELVREFLAAHEFLFHMKLGPNTLYFKAAHLAPGYMVKAPYASLSYVARQQLKSRTKEKTYKQGSLLKVDVDVMYNPKNNHIFFVTHDHYPCTNTITIKLREDEQQNLSFLAWLPGNDQRDPIMSADQVPVRCGLKRFVAQTPLKRVMGAVHMEGNRVQGDMVAGDLVKNIITTPKA